MNSFKLFRTICRSTCIFRNSYFNFMYCRLDDICKNRSGITYNRLIIIVIKNQCPFCGKSLRVVPINSEEYCPHCGCKIEQEHKKIQVCRIQKYNMKCEIERMEIIYTFYFFAFLKKVIKKLLTFCYWKGSKIYSD